MPKKKKEKVTEERIIQELVPEQYWEKVFFHNANRIYGLGLK